MEFYTKALRHKGYSLSYVDAFAGTGEIPYSTEMPLLEGVLDFDHAMDGSAKRALDVSVPFHSYIFADNSRKNIAELHALKGSYPNLAERIHIKQEDANDVVKSFCMNMSSNDRAVIFLDPFGNSVAWETLEIISASKKVDLWYLFPAWIGVARQVSNAGKLHSDAENSIDRMMGPCDWRSHCIEVQSSDQASLFVDEVQAKKIATADGITKFMIERMRTIFGGGVNSNWLPLGRNGQHWYSLLFACSNPDYKAMRLAQRVAGSIMTRK